MTLIDFLIGVTLMNAMPHFVLGVWKGRMFSGLGFGNQQNILYGLMNFIISVGLFIFRYGAGELLENGIYLGALSVLLVYFLTGKFWYSLFNKP